MMDRLRRRLAALEAQRSTSAGGFIVVPSWITGDEWDAYVGVRLVKLAPGRCVVVIPDKGRLFEEAEHA